MRPMSGDAVAMLQSAVRSFLEEVPALEPMKVVAQVDFIARGDTQQFRIEMPGPKIERGAAPEAKIRIEMRRDFFNAMVEAGAKVADWREAFTYGKAKATGVEQYLRLIEQVVEKAEERQRMKHARHQG